MVLQLTQGEVVTPFSQYHSDSATIDSAISDSAIIDLIIDVIIEVIIEVGPNN